MMEAERVALEKKGRKGRRSSKKAVNYIIVPDYFPSTLPSRDLEVPSITTHHTISDYLKADMASPRDRQFEDKLDVVPIPREKEFVDVPAMIDSLLVEVQNQSEERPTLYVCTSIAVERGGHFFALKLRGKYFLQNPSRVILLPQHPALRTFAVFTTEKTLPANLDT